LLIISQTFHLNPNEDEVLLSSVLENSAGLPSRPVLHFQLISTTIISRKENWLCINGVCVVMKH